MESVIINFEERGASRTADKVSTLNSEFRNMKSVMTSLNQVIKQSDDKTEGLNYKFRLLTEMMKNADARIANFKNQIKSLGTQLEESDAKVKGFKESVGRIEAELKGVTTAIGYQEEDLRRLNGRYESGKISLKEYEAEQSRIESSLKNLRSQQSTYEQSLKEVNASLKTATTEHNKLNTALTRANTGLMNAQTQFAQYEMEIKQVENRLQTLGDEARETGNDIESLGNEASSASAKLGKLSDATKETKDSFSGVNGKLLSFTLGMQEIGQQLRQVTSRMFDFGMEAYQTSKKVQSTAETTTRVYKELADEQKKWASETSKTMNVFENDLADASAKMYSLAQSFGTTGTLFEGTAGEMTMSSEELMKMTQKLTERAYDLAATYDTSVEQALGAVLSATKGNTEAIEDYGVSVQANALEQLALSKGIGKSVEQMTQAEKTALVMEQILSKTADTAGRYAYEIEAGLNPMLEMDTAMKNLQQVLGEKLKPLFDAGIDSLVKMMDAISNLSPELLDLGIAIAIAVAGLAGISTIIGAVGVLALTLGPAFGAIMLPLVAGTLLAIPLITAFMEHLRTGEDIATIISNKFSELGTAIETFTSQLLIHGPSWVQAGGEFVNNLIQGFFMQLPSMIQSVTVLINGFVNAVMASMPQIIEQGLSMLSNLIVGMWNGLPYLISAVVDIIVNFLSTLDQNLPAILGKGVEVLLNFVDGIISGFPTLVQSIVTGLGKFIQAIIDHGPSIVRAGAQALANLIKGIVDRLPDLISTAVKAIGQFAGGLMDNFPKLLQAGGDMLMAVVDGITAVIGSIVGVGTKIVEGLWEGLKGSWDWLKDKVGGLFSGLGDVLTGWIPGPIKSAIGLSLDVPDEGVLRKQFGNISYGFVPQVATMSPFAGVNTDVPQVMTESGYSAERQATLMSSYGSNSTTSGPSNIVVENNQPLNATIENIVMLDGKEMTRYTENVVVKKLAKDKRNYKRS